MANTKITDHVDAVTSDYIHDNVQDMVYDAFVGLNLFASRGQVKFHGGSDSQYPYVSTGISANYYTGMYDGTIQTAITPTSTDLVDAAHQEGWGFWYKHEALTHEEFAANSGPWAAKQRGPNLIKVKLDALLNDAGYMFDQNLANGNGSNNTILGLIKLMDVTNTNYLGWNFAAGDSALRPSRVQIATSYTSLTMADIFEAYGDIEDKGRFADTILLHPDVKKKLRTMTEATVRRSQGGNASIGHLNFDALEAEVISWRAMPTTTSTRIDFLNFGSHVKKGVKGDTTHTVPEGKNFILEFAGPSPLGMKQTGWMDWTKIGYPGVMMQILHGAFKLACTKPKDQAYIDIE